MSTLFDVNEESDDENDSDYRPDNDDESEPEIMPFEHVEEVESDPKADVVTTAEEKERIDEIWQSFQKDSASTLKRDSVQISTEKDNITTDKSTVDLTSLKKISESTSTKKPCDSADDAVNTESNHDQISDEASNEKINSSPIIPETAAVSTILPQKRSSFDTISSSISSLKHPRPTTSSTSMLGQKRSGLDDILNRVGNKKPKISTLQQSLSDWKSFKKDEGLEEELQQYNKGKGGFIERQSFLQRSDYRSFEIEKSLRLSRK